LRSQYYIRPDRFAQQCIGYAQHSGLRNGGVAEQASGDAMDELSLPSEPSTPEQAPHAVVALAASTVPVSVSGSGNQADITIPLQISLQGHTTQVQLTLRLTLDLTFPR
jgi:hypothetical protein